MKKYLLLIAMTYMSSSASYAVNIEFKDSVVKALCISEWDMNGDGELSEDEAASVTSLGSVFSEKADIRSFHELRYFTGISRIDDYAFYQSGLKEMTLPTSVTEIGEYAFSQSALGEMVSVPGHVKTIGKYAFHGCYNLKRVILEEGVERVESYAFHGPLMVLSLPSTLTYLGYRVVRITGGTVEGNFILPEGFLYVFAHARQPATIHTNAFFALFGDGMLIVPHGSKDDYKAVYAWNRFIDILEFGDVNEDGYVNVADVVAMIDYILGNKPSRFNLYIADVNGDGMINIADVTMLIDLILNE